MVLLSMIDRFYAEVNIFVNKFSCFTLGFGRTSKIDNVWIYSMYHNLNETKCIRERF